MKKKFYITTPIYYVNDVPHVGHAYSTIGADVLARYKRSCGEEVYFLTGTDEHGLKIEKAAKEKGFDSPRAFVESIVPHFKEAWRVLDITHDRFIRTTDEDHKRCAQEFWKRVQAAGYIEKRSYEGWYCYHDEAFHLEKDLKQPGNLCPDCERPVQRTKEENYFFKLTAFKDQLRGFLAANPELVNPESRRNEVLGSYLDVADGVQDVSISRSTIAWGIPVPGDEKQVIYVWFDALLNYLTATGWPAEGYRETWPADVHIIGKEILRFHAVLWPAMLLAAGVETPKQVFGTGWLIKDGKKMSKSLGNVADPIEWSERYGNEVLRYYLLREVPFGQDGNITAESLEGRYNAELANGLGNLLARTLGMAEKYLGGKLARPADEALASDRLLKGLAAYSEAYEGFVEKLAFHQALDQFNAAVRDANLYVDESGPWKLAKSPETRKELELCLYALAETLRRLAYMIAPFMPKTANRMLAQLGVTEHLIGPKGEIEGATVKELLRGKGSLADGQPVVKGDGLFPRIEAAKV